MKKLLILLVFSTLLLNCAKKQKVEEKQDDFLKVYSSPETEKINTPTYHEKSSSSVPTYWYVTFEEYKYNEKGEVIETIDWHRTIKINTPYFDFIKAREALPVEVIGDCYFDFITQINKESYDSYMIYREKCFKSKK